MANKKINIKFNYFELINYNSPKITIKNWAYLFFITFILGAFFCLIISFSITSEDNVSKTFLTLYPFFILTFIIALLNRFLKSPYLIPLIYILDFQTKFFSILGIIGFFLFNQQNFILYYIFLVYIFSALPLLLNDEQCQKLNQLISGEKRNSKKETSKIHLITELFSIITIIIYVYTTNLSVQITILLIFSIISILFGLYSLIVTGIRVKLLILDLIRQKQSTPKK